jgi:hypothetical protein
MVRRPVVLVMCCFFLCATKAFVKSVACRGWQNGGILLSGGGYGAAGVVFGGV